MASISNYIRRHGLWIAALLSLAVASPAQATDFDTPIEMWRLALTYLGQPSGTAGQEFAQYDSTYDMIPATNDALRRVATDIGVTAFDTVTIAANTFRYALNTNFMENGTSTIPLSAVRISANGKEISGLRNIPFSDFASSVSSSGPQNISPVVTGFAMTGQVIWLYPAGTVGDKVYITGPAHATPITHGADTTNIYDEDRVACVYWMVSQLARSRGYIDLANDYSQKYVHHVTVRTGKAPAIGGGQLTIRPWSDSLCWCSRWSVSPTRS